MAATGAGPPRNTGKVVMRAWALVCVGLGGGGSCERYESGLEVEGKREMIVDVSEAQTLQPGSWEGVGFPTEALATHPYCAEIVSNVQRVIWAWGRLYWWKRTYHAPPLSSTLSLLPLNHGVDLLLPVYLVCGFNLDVVREVWSGDKLSTPLLHPRSVLLILRPKYD